MPARAPPRAWQRMLSGRRLDLLNPSPLDIEIEDIAHGLARVARWNGQTAGPYIFSVAQHSLLVAAVAEHLAPRLPASSGLTILLHDAPEYVIGDVISPFKLFIGEAYRSVEARLLAAIHLRFSLPAEAGEPLKRLTKRADRIAAYLEATHLAGFTREEAARCFGRPEGVSSTRLEELLVPWPAERAQERYLAAFTALAQGLEPFSPGALGQAKAPP